MTSFRTTPQARVPLQGGIPAAALPRRRRRRFSPFALLVLAVATLLIAWSGITFLATVTATVSVSVSPRQVDSPPPGTGSTLPAGQTIDVVPTTPSTAFTVKHGGPHKDAGRQLFRVQVEPANSHRLSGTFAWIDPMNSPFSNGFIEVGLYYQVPTAGCDEGAGDFVLTEGVQTYDELGEAGTNLCLRPASDVRLLTQQVASVQLRSNGAATNRNYIYVIASILNAGHNAPPGQQPDLGSLEFLFVAR